MADSGEQPAVDALTAALEDLAGAVDRLRAVDLTALGDVAVEDGLRRFVSECRRLPGVRNGLVAEVSARGLPALRSVSSMGAYLKRLLRVSVAEGRGWERAADELVGRRSLSSADLLAPVCPGVAAAFDAGAISTTHARLITETLRRLPVSVSAGERARAEVRLVRCARAYDPHTLARRCAEEADRLDPDGTLGSTPEERDRARSFHLGGQDRHGMWRGSGRLDPATRALLTAALSPLAAPQPQPDGTLDPRTGEQRWHDALHGIARRALAQGDLPVRHGLPATLLVTMTLEQLEARAGVATTGHGGRLPVRDVLRLAADSEVIPVVLDTDGQVLHFGAEQRLATLAQRQALFVLDGGCTYPGCAIPAAWCESGHGEPFRTSHKTTIDDLALLCGYHHRQTDNQHWHIERIQGRVWLTPPAWIDPDQTPQTNEHFHPLRE